MRHPASHGNAIDPPYTELVTYLGIHRELERPLAHVGLRRQRRPRTAITATNARSVGLRDTITPPSTVFAAFNAIEAPKEIVVFPYSGHSLPTGHIERQLTDVAQRLT